MKPKVTNTYFYHTPNAFISMIFFLFPFFLNEQTKLFSLWSCTIPSFQICGTWQMSFIVSKPLGIIFCLLQLWWSQWQPDSYTATESNQHESFMRLLIHGIIRLESQKKDDRVLHPVQQTNSSVSCHKIRLPLPQHFLPLSFTNLLTLPSHFNLMVFFLFHSFFRFFSFEPSDQFLSLQRTKINDDDDVIVYRNSQSKQREFKVQEKKKNNIFIG